MGELRIREKALGPLPSSIPQVTIVIPVYGNQETLEELSRRVQHVLGTRCATYEMLFVDDASPDDSLNVLERLAQADNHVAVLALEKNVGQHRAIIIGLSQARGKWVVVMDADLQDPPEAIPKLLKKLQEGGGAVFAGRRGRYESRLRLLTSRLFKWSLHMLCGVPADAGLFVAMNREMLKRLLAFGESRPFVVPMMGCSGLPLTSVPVERAQRAGDTSAYSFCDRLRVGFQAIIWVFHWRWGSGRRTSAGEVNHCRVKAHFGARFTRTRKSAMGTEARP